MKKAILSLLIIICSLSATQTKAEVWLDLGVKGGFAPGVFTNPYLLSSTDQALKFSPGYLFGIKGAVNFGLKHALTIDFLYATTTQRLSSASLGTSTYLNLATLDLPILYRVNGETGGYGEIGPQFSFTQSATQGIDGGAQFDAKNKFKPVQTAIAFGFGQYIGGGDAFGLNFGFRFAYSLADIIAPSFDNKANDPIYQPTTPEDAAAYNYEKSGRLYAGIVLEFNFNLGYFAKGAACTKKTKFRMF